MKLPLLAIIGARNWLTEGSQDSAKRFLRPILDAWGLDYLIIEKTEELPRLGEHLEQCRRSARPGAVILAEGSG